MYVQRSQLKLHEFPLLIDNFELFNIFQIESCNRFWFQSEKESDKVLEFEMYVRNYRKDVIEPISSGDRLIVGRMVMVQVEACKGVTYHRAKIMSANLINEVCRVSKTITNISSEITELNSNRLSWKNFSSFRFV